MSRLRHAVEILFRASRNFYRDNCLDLSATVAFYSLLSLGPLLFLVGTTLRAVFKTDAGAQSAVDRIATVMPAEATPMIRAVMENLDQTRGLLILAVPGLFWVATSALSSLEYAVNVAAGTAPRRRFWRSRMKALLVLSIGWLVVGVSQVGGSLITYLPGGPTRLPGSLSYTIQLCATFLAFLIFYKVLPRGPVLWRASAQGAVLALVLWEAARRLFATLLLRSPAFGLLTGTLAGVVAFLLWIYTAVAVILLGAELTAVLNGRPADSRGVHAGPKTTVPSAS